MFKRCPILLKRCTGGLCPPLSLRIRRKVNQWQNRQQIKHIARQVDAYARKSGLHQHPAGANPRLRPSDARADYARLHRSVVVFNASSRLTGFSLNASYTILAGWALRLQGLPVKYFVCKQGMTHCMLGTKRGGDHGELPLLDQPPPCQACINLSKRLYTAAEVNWFSYTEEPDLTAALQGLSIDELSCFEYTSPHLPLTPSPYLALSPSHPKIPLGRLVLPSVRWILRRHNLVDDEPTRRLLREYILSAYSIAREFAAFLHRENPSTALIFNGHTYPEATARWVARQIGVRSVAYEVGFQAFSAFFTEGEPTAYPIDIPDDFELTPEQNARLDAQLEKRFQGQFSMAGIRFWPEMRGLDQDFLAKASQHKQIVPVFTNVVYDTSQVHANTIFPHMFAWLDLVLEIIRSHPETLFVIRAHPDEKRPGSKKISNEAVSDWVIENSLWPGGHDQLTNVVFIDSQEYLSSYELIQRSKFVMVYNSSIGLEAALLGMPVICGGKARYTRYPTVFLPDSPEALKLMVEEFLASEKINVPLEYQRNARRFLYYQFYRVSIPFGEYLKEGVRQGYVFLKPFNWRQLLPENSLAIRVLLDGILNHKPFILPE